VAAAEAFIRFLRADSASDARRHWAITAEEKWSGLIGLHTWQHHHRRAELGCDMAVTRWGQGIAGEAARAVIHYGIHDDEAAPDPGAHNRRQPPVGPAAGATRFRREGALREYSMEDDLTD
jgi:RimJ/RimL family protein N-acetyltransferase